MRPLTKLNQVRWYARVPLKLALFAVVVLFVCYPNPALLYKNVGRWRNPNVLINPASPALDTLHTEIQSKMTTDLPPREALRAVEQLVIRRVPYAFDWDNWGAVDYFPTVEEIMSRGREDCDGRAIIAASLLRRLGFEAYVVADFAHAWVRTPHGDLMGPGKADAVVATPTGFKLRWKALRQLPSAFGYGVAVFPHVREIIILLAAWLMMLGKPGNRRYEFAALFLALIALAFMRRGNGVYNHPVVWMQRSAWLLFATALILLLLIPFLRIRRRNSLSLTQ